MKKNLGCKIYKYNLFPIIAVVALGIFSLASFAFENIAHAAPPTLTPVTPVSSPTKDNTPSYTFDSSSDGTITYTDPICKSTISTVAVIGSNTVTFDALADGTYPNCAIVVTETAAPYDFSTITANTFTVDTTAPNVSTFNIPGSYNNLTLPITDFIATDAVGVTGYMITETSTAPAFDDTGWAGTAPSNYAFTTDGAKILYAWAKDGAGNVSLERSASVDIDTTPPTISITSPDNNSIINNSTPILTYSISDGTAVVKLDGAVISKTSGDNLDTLAASSHTITIEATDSFGNFSTKTNTFTYINDFTGPTITINKGPSLVPVQSDTINITVTDSGSGVYTQTYGFSDNDTCDANDTMNIPLPNGANFTLSGTDSRYLCVKATDFVSNVTYQKIGQLHLDSTGPAIFEVTPVPSPSNNTPLIYTFHSDKAGGIIYGGSCSSLSTSAASGDNAIIFNKLPSGTYTNCTITVTDVAGNYSNVLAVNSPNGFIFNAPPRRTNGLPSGILPAGTTQTTVSLTTDKNATCKYANALDANLLGIVFDAKTGIFDTTGGTTHSVLATGLADGNNYAYFVSCRDANGSTNSLDREYLISFSVASAANPVVVNQRNSHNSGKKATPARTTTNSRSNVKNGQTITQRGKKFSKNSIILLYFSKYGGAYYPPMKIKTSSTGSFATTYRVNKPKGTYTWYAVDTKTGSKSKVTHYHVKL